MRAKNIQHKKRSCKKLIVWFPGCGFMLGILMLTTAASAQSGHIQAQTGYVVPHAAVRSPLPSPSMTRWEDCYKCQKRGGLSPWAVRLQDDPRIDPENLIPLNPPTVLQYAPEGGRGTRAPGDFVFYHNHEFTQAEMGNWYGYVMEPTFGVNGRTVFWAGNFYAAVSGDYGQSFDYINIFDNFPADNQIDLVYGAPACCDQIVYYERTRGAYFWLIMYHVAECDSINVQRIAVANSQQDVIENNWFWYDFTPENFGFPYEGSYWFDFPYLTVSDNYLYHVTKLLDWTVNDTCYGLPKATADGRTLPQRLYYTRTLVARYPLDEMSQGLPMEIHFIVPEDTHGMRGTHGATSTMYFGAHLSTATMRVYRWPEGTVDIDWEDVDHGGFVGGLPMIAPGPDGHDWAGHMDNWIEGAWVANGVIGFMFAAAQGGGFPYPHVQVLRFNEVDRSLLSQGQIWNPEYAYMYPAVHPNDRGHVGGTIVFGGGINYPGAAAWIADDYNGGVITPLENYAFAVGTDGPDSNRWGDYLTARRNVPYGNTWGGSGHRLVGGSTDQDAVGHYVWFGRERDTPPLLHTIHVNWTNTSGYEDGSYTHPYDTVNEGHFATVGGDSLIIWTGNYPESVTLHKQIYLKNEGGSVTIGE